MEFLNILTTIYLALFGIAATLIGLPGFLEKTHLSKFIKRKTKTFRVICLSGAFVFLGCAIYQYTDNKRSAEDISDLRIDINGYKAIMDSINSDPSTTVKNGKGVSGIFRILDQLEKRDKYILDAGDFVNRNRISLYIDSSNSLVYRIIDNEGQVYSIKTPRNHFTFKKGARYFFYLDYGVSDDFSFMRLYLDKHKIGEVRIWNNSINPVIIEGNLLFATDITKSVFGKIEFSLVSVLKTPLNQAQIDSLTIIYVRFIDKLGID